MTDREKIIKEWEAVLSRDPLDAPWDLIDDTLTMLKEQEAVKPEIKAEWTSVKDRLPDEKQSKITHDFEYVLCATTFGDVRAYKFGTPIGWSEPHFWHGAGKMDEYVTHWMPFPDMPVQTKSDSIDCGMVTNFRLLGDL